MASITHGGIHNSQKTKASLKYHIKENSRYYEDQEVYYVEQQPDNATVSNIFQQQVYLDFTLTRAVDRLHYLELAMTLQNTSANPISILPAHFLLDHYQLWGPNILIEEVYAINQSVLLCIIKFANRFFFLTLGITQSLSFASF